MKKIILTILTSFLIVISSCNDENVSILNNFPSPISLDKETCITNECIAPKNIILMDELLVFKEKGQDKLLRCFDLEKGILKQFLSKGNGPGEVNNVIRITTSDSILQVFTDPEKILLYHYKDLQKEKIFPQKEQSLPSGQSAFASAFQILPNQIFYSGKRSETDTCRYCIYNIGSDSIYSFAGFPQNDLNIQGFPTFDMSKQLAYQGDFVFSPTKNKIFFFFFYGLGFDIIDINKQEINFQKIYQYPDVRINHISELNINKVTRNPNSFCGFIDAYATETSIYVLYTDKRFSEDYSSGKHILQYNWEGEPKKHYIVNTEINSIAVDETNEILYATTNEESARIIKYNMK